jgi:serine/threonine protein kinase
MTAVRRSCGLEERHDLLHKPSTFFSLLCCDNAICLAVAEFFRKGLCFKLNDSIDDGYRYVRQNVIGKGGNAVVYKAYDCREGKPVVIKQCLKRTEEDVSLQQREYYIQDTLAKKIANIPLVKGFYVNPGNSACIVMEYVDCPNLYEGYVRESKRRKLMSIHDIFFVKNQLINVVVDMAKESFLHCDIKAANILYKGIIKVIDFGMSHQLDDNGKVITDGYLLQTRSYRSPASVLNVPLTLRDDLWGVGCVLFELYTQKSLFRTYGTDTFDTINEYLQMIIKVMGAMPPNDMLQQSKNLDEFFYVSKKSNGEVVNVSLKYQVNLPSSLLSIRKAMLAAAKMRGKFVYDKANKTTGDDELLIQLVEKLVSYDDITMQDAYLLL